MASAEPGKPERRAPRRAGAAVRRRRPLRGEFSVPGDKSISHRAVLLAAIAGGKSRIQGFSPAEDCRASLALVRQLGCRVATRPGGELAVTGLAPGAAPPDGSLTVDCGRSGTTMRLGLGLLAAQPINCVMTGHPQLLARPMARVVDPLRAMGARISMSPTGTAPLEVTGGGLLGITYTPPRASAQVKSALLLAGLGAGSVTTVVEPNPTRDHTERLLLAMGAQLTVSRSGPGLRLRLRPGPLAPLRLRVPGDPSSAAVLA
ncbi:MAG: 3-phosphoshikimate 1-carboxyvinyltransferase, partial [Candidatus Dormibacteria bacterium]